MRHKDLKSLKDHISQYESHLGQDTSGDNAPNGDDLLGHGAEVEMAAAPGANDPPSESASTQASNPPPTEGHAMEVDEEDVVSPPASPVSHEDNELLSGGDAIRVDAGLAHLTVSSPRGPDGKGEEASILEALSLLVKQ